MAEHAASAHDRGKWSLVSATPAWPDQRRSRLLRPALSRTASLLKLAGPKDWPIPDRSTRWQRQRAVTVQIPDHRSGGLLGLLVDSTGVKMAGKGGWQVRRHGPGGQPQWRKVHLPMGTATGGIRAVEFTSSQPGDSSVVPDLLAPIPVEQPISTLTADGA